MATVAQKKMIPLSSAGMAATMVSSRPALALGATEFQILENVRNRYGVIEARKSEASWTLTGFTGTPVFYGSWAGTIGGTEYALVAVKNSTYCEIYDSSDSSAFTNRSASSGAYGDTRLSDSAASSNGVSFCPVNDMVLGEAVLISDGVTTLLWQPSAVNGARLRKVEAFSGTIGTTRDVSIVQDFPLKWNANDNGGIVSSTVSGCFTTESNPSATRGFDVWTIEVANPQANSSQATIIWKNTVSLNNQFQIGVLVGSTAPTDDIISSCVFRVGNSGGYTVVYDPAGADTAYNPPTVEEFKDVPGLADTALLYTYTLPSSAIGNVDRLQWEYAGGSTTRAAQTLTIYAAVVGGSAVPRVPNYALTYRNAGTGVESASIVLNADAAKGMKMETVESTGDIDARFPISGVLRANWKVTPLPGAAASAFDQFCLYRKDDGSTAYLFATSGTRSTYSSGWSGTSVTLTDTADETGLNPERVAPSAYNTCPPAFVAGITANGRAFLATGTEYKFSEFRQPMRFGVAVDVNNFDRSSGGYKFASENAKAFAYAPTSGDVDRITVLTDKATYSVTGLDTYSIMRPSRTTQRGIIAPKSVATRREQTFYLDDARLFQIEPGTGKLENVGWQVKDILDGIPSAYIAKCYGVTFDDRYYLFYPASGQTTNRNALVFDLISGALVRDTYGSNGIVSAHVFGGKLIAFYSNGTAKQLEEGSSTVAVTIKTREIPTWTGDYWNAGRHRVYCDEGNALLTVSYIPGKTSTGKTTTLSTTLDSGDARIDRYTVQNVALQSRSISFSLTGTLPSGWKLYRWEIETDGRASDGDV